jgi:hypothetical protein
VSPCSTPSPPRTLRGIQIRCGGVTRGGSNGTAARALRKGSEGARGTAAVVRLHPLCSLLGPTMAPSLSLVLLRRRCRHPSDLCINTGSSLPIASSSSTTLTSSPSPRVPPPPPAPRQRPHPAPASGGASRPQDQWLSLFVQIPLTLSPCPNAYRDLGLSPCTIPSHSICLCLTAVDSIASTLLFFKVPELIEFGVICDCLLCL